MGASTRKRPPFRTIWDAGADLASKRILLGLWCGRYHGLPARHLFRQFLLPRRPWIEFRLNRGNGLRLCLRRDDRGDQASFFENFFELPIDPGLCREPGVIADAGAHIGCFSLLAHSFWPRARVLAFEPDAGNVELLSRNFRLNSIPGEVVPKAVWKEPARLQFAANKSNGGFLTAGAKSGEVGPESVQQTVEIEATSLSAFFGADLAKVDLLKLDIEGAELPVLETELPRLASGTTILCELHFARKYQGQFEALLERHGWRAQLYDSNHPPHSTWIVRHG